MCKKPTVYTFSTFIVNYAYVYLNQQQNVQMEKKTTLTFLLTWKPERVLENWPETHRPFLTSVFFSFYDPSTEQQYCN